MNTKTRSFILFLGILGFVVLLAGCHKTKIAAAPPPPPPEAKPSPPPSPTVSLSAEPATVEKGHSVTLSWTSENATSLDLQPSVGSVQATGSTTVTPEESTTYILTVSGPGGKATASARVTVTLPPPPPPTPGVSETTIEEMFSTEVKDVYFDFDKSDIRPDAQQSLAHDAEIFKEHPEISFTIEGHCDERGSEEYNLGLGDRRATATKNYLVNLGVPADRISTISYGKDRPFCSESTEECWQQNRRGHFTVGKINR